MLPPKVAMVIPTSATHHAKQCSALISDHTGRRSLQFSRAPMKVPVMMDMNPMCRDSRMNVYMLDYLVVVLPVTCVITFRFAERVDVLTDWVNREVGDVDQVSVAVFVKVQVRVL
jgi:hypothetical protein